MVRKFLLIPGRSSRQGVTLNEGKYTDGYLDETSTLRMNPDDMRQLGISDGDEVRMWNDIGEVVVACIDAKEECPEGLVFICYGDKSSQLMSGETHGTGMPDSKALDVFIHPASEPRPADPVPVVSPTATAAQASGAGPAVTTEPATSGSAAPASSESVQRSAATTQPVGSESKDGGRPVKAAVAATTASSAPRASQPGSTNGIGPTVVLGLFVIALIVLAIVMNLGS